jgi:hypothetical protein
MEAREFRKTVSELDKRKGWVIVTQADANDEGRVTSEPGSWNVPMDHEGGQIDPPIVASGTVLPYQRRICGFGLMKTLN